jgi:hypothetical protein
MEDAMGRDVFGKRVMVRGCLLMTMSRRTKDLVVIITGMCDSFLLSFSIYLPCVKQWGVKKTLDRLNLGRKSSPFVFRLGRLPCVVLLLILRHIIFYIFAKSCIYPD